MSWFLALTFFHGFLILVDELVFHRKRGLPLWERWGHPLDALLVLACLLFLLFMDRTSTTERIYLVLMGLSCVTVTKDEFIHYRICTSHEMWLHSVLFITHPLILLSSMAIWETQRLYLLLGAIGSFIFLLYQIIYWNFLKPPKTQEQEKVPGSK